MDSAAFASLKRAVTAALAAADGGPATADSQALDLLVIGLSRVIEQVGRKARFLAESANRAECTLDDINSALSGFENLIGTKASNLPPLNISVKPGNFNSPELPQISGLLANPTEPRPSNLASFPWWLAKEIEVNKSSAQANLPNQTVPLLPSGQGEEEAKLILTRHLALN